MIYHNTMKTDLYSLNQSKISTFVKVKLRKAYKLMNLTDINSIFNFK